MEISYFIVCFAFACEGSVYLGGNIISGPNIEETRCRGSGTSVRVPISRQPLGTAANLLLQPGLISVHAAL